VRVGGTEAWPTHVENDRVGAGAQRSSRKSVGGFGLGAEVERSLSQFAQGAPVVRTNILRLDQVREGQFQPMQA
jgi:hypothetical protein